MHDLHPDAVMHDLRQATYLIYGETNFEKGIKKMDEITAKSEALVRKEYARLTRFLIDRHLTVSTMESATGGQLASLITDTEGSSAVLRGAFVTYCNEAKIMQGVPAEIINKYSVYSEETASAMAEACRRTYGADIGIGVTGTFGNPDPANPASSHPGRVYYAIALDSGTYSRSALLAAAPDRLSYKLTMAGIIYDELAKLLGIEAEALAQP